MPKKPEVIVSFHAKRRFKQRTPWPARACQKAAVRALKEGTDTRELNPFVVDRLLAMEARHQKVAGTYMKLWNGYVFVFGERRDLSGGADPIPVLVTVFDYDTENLL